MARSQRAAWIIVVAIAMIAWAVVTLGYRALLMDPACGGVACDQIRGDSANLRAMLVVAWVVGEVIGATALIWLWRRRTV